MTTVQGYENLIVPMECKARRLPVVMERDDTFGREQPYVEIPEDPVLRRNMQGLAVLANRFQPQAIHVRAFGADPNGVVAAAAAIQAAIDAAGANGVVDFRNGTWLLDSGISTTYDNQTWLLDGAQFKTTSDFTDAAAITIGQASSETDHVQFIGKFRIRPWTTGSANSIIGLLVLNSYYCKIDSATPQYFEVGVEGKGTNGHGCHTNELHLGHLIGNITGLKFATDSTGYCNQWTVIGGRIALDSAQAFDASAGYAIELAPASGITMDGHTFVGVNIEGNVITDNPTWNWFYGIYLDAINCVFLGCRLELGTPGANGNFTKSITTDTTAAGAGCVFICPVSNSGDTARENINPGIGHTVKPLWIDAKSGVDSRWGKAQSNWDDSTSPAFVSVKLCDSAGANVTGAAFNVYFPTCNGRHPNVEAGEVIPFQLSEGNPITYMEQDDAIGTMKLWVGTAASVPTGWGIMDNQDAAGHNHVNRGGSGINLSLNPFLKFDASTAGTLAPAANTGDNSTGLSVNQNAKAIGVTHKAAEKTDSQITNITIDDHATLSHSYGTQTAQEADGSPNSPDGINDHTIDSHSVTDSGHQHTADSMIHTVTQAQHTHSTTETAHDHTAGTPANTTVIMIERLDNSA